MELLSIACLFIMVGTSVGILFAIDRLCSRPRWDLPMDQDEVIWRVSGQAREGTPDVFNEPSNFEWYIEDHPVVGFSTTNPEPEDERPIEI